MKRHHIPTANFAVFTDVVEAVGYVKENYRGGDVVIKASGLAAGKGVLLPETIQEAVEGLEMMMVSKEFGSAGTKKLASFLYSRMVEIFGRGILNE
jgi:phosphoribosylamine-glycine ligase